MSIILKHWKLILIVMGILIALLWVGSITGTNRKLLNMVADQIRVDQSKIVTTLEETVTQRENEIADLQNKIEANQRQQALLRQENSQLKGKILEIQNQRQNITVSSDPDRIVDELHNLGFGSVRRRTSP